MRAQKAQVKAIRAVLHRASQAKGHILVKSENVFLMFITHLPNYCIMFAAVVTRSK